MYTELCHQFPIPHLLLGRNPLTTRTILLVFSGLWYSCLSKTFQKGSTVQYDTPTNYIPVFRKGKLVSVLQSNVY